jgi:hypothetical protein
MRGDGGQKKRPRRWTALRPLVSELRLEGDRWGNGLPAEGSCTRVIESKLLIHELFPATYFENPVRESSKAKLKLFRPRGFGNKCQRSAKAMSGRPEIMSGQKKGRPNCKNSGGTVRSEGRHRDPYQEMSVLRPARLATNGRVSARVADSSLRAGLPLPSPQRELEFNQDCSRWPTAREQCERRNRFASWHKGLGTNNGPCRKAARLIFGGPKRERRPLGPDGPKPQSAAHGGLQRFVALIPSESK